MFLFDLDLPGVLCSRVANSALPLPQALTSSFVISPFFRKIDYWSRRFFPLALMIIPFLLSFEDAEASEELFSSHGGLMAAPRKTPAPYFSLPFPVDAVGSSLASLFDSGSGTFFVESLLPLSS